MDGPIICISHINSIGIYISKPCHLKGVSSGTENSKWSRRVNLNWLDQDYLLLSWNF